MKYTLTLSALILTVFNASAEEWRCCDSNVNPLFASSGDACAEKNDSKDLLVKVVNGTLSKSLKVGSSVSLKISVANENKFDPYLAKRVSNITDRTYGDIVEIEDSTTQVNLSDISRKQSSRVTLYQSQNNNGMELTFIVFNKVKSCIKLK